MSLAIQQSLLQAKSDLADLNRRIAVGEDTPQIKARVNGTKKEIARLEKQIEEMKAKQKAEAPKAVKTQGPLREERQREERPKKPRFEDMDLTCSACTNCFVFTGEEQFFFKKRDWKTPVRCPECREAKKNKKPAGKQIACGDCKSEFFFPEAKQKQFAELNYPDPKWCRPCKAARKAKWEAEKAAAAAAGASADAVVVDAGAEILEENTA